MATDSPSNARTVHYVLSTHWDREWYQSFQDYRQRLVRLMDNLVDGFESSRLQGPFQADGQSIVLEDYLEIRPENTETIRRYISDGRIIAGPWYVLPDEFLVSGESIIRNIRLGRRIARDFGGTPSDAGFVCDLFGHISQLPQIFHGFGIETGYLWRGVNQHDKHHLIWEGADGSELVCYKYLDFGYCDYAFKVRDCHLFEKPFDLAQNTKQLDDYITASAEKTEIDSLLLFDGGDHQEWDPQVYEVLEKAMAEGREGYDLRHTSLDEYQKEMVAQKDKITRRYKGELRETGYVSERDAHQIHGVLSSRVWIKQDNCRAQNLLTNEAEPMSAFAAMALGVDTGKGYLPVAWKWLLKNHPHDSICGCSIDQVHEDMKYRFSQALQIGEVVTRESTLKIAASVEGEPDDKEIRLLVFNPASQDFDGTTEVELMLPPDYPQFGEFFIFERLPVFTVHGADGKEIPYQRVRQALKRQTTRIWYQKFPQPLEVDKVTISLPVQVPAMGYTTLTVRPAKDKHPKRYSQVPSLVTGERTMENEYVRVEIAGNGTVTLTDKETGEVYPDLFTYEDRADIGDGWFHGVAVNDQIQTSAGAQTDVLKIEDGKYVSSFRIITTMMVPDEFVFNGMVRSGRRVPFVIDTVLRLRPGKREVEVETHIDNNVKDHRLRVLLPSAVDASTYISDTAFDVIERDIALPEDNHERFELEVETKPQQTFTAVFDKKKKRGLAVISEGLMESAVRDVKERTLALTLFRSTRRTVMTDGEPEGQLLMPLTFRYELRPLAGKPDVCDLFNAGLRLGSPVRDVQMQKPDIGLHRQKTAMPRTAGFIKVEGHAVFSSCRLVDGAVEVRLFNPHDKEVDAKLDWLANPEAMDQFTSVTPVDFESNPVGESKNLTGRGHSLKVGAKKIVTLRFEV